MNVRHRALNPGRTPSAGLTEAGDAARGQGSIVNVASIASGVTAVGVTQLHLRTFAYICGSVATLRSQGLLRPSKSAGVEGLVN